MRIALFGGSFDPPHRGHLAIARAAADRFALDTVLFAPAGRQPLKSVPAAATFEQRLAMLTLASAEDLRFTVSSLDAPRPDHQPNYTVDSLTRLKAQYPRAQLFALAGADSFRDLARWKDPERLLELADWIVVSRPGYALADPKKLTLTPAQRARIHLLDSVHEDVSATELRERLREDDPCADLLPPAVAAYIRQHHLYLGKEAG
jgi:nicotinate-nucleotide adenylyltransferase